MRRMVPFRIIAAVLLITGTARADLQVNLEGVGDSLRIGDRLDLRLSVNAPATGQLVLPDWTQTLAPFELLAQPDTVAFQRSENRQQLDLHLPVTCFDDGVQVLQPIPIQWRSSDSTMEDSAETEPVIVAVVGVIPDSVLAMVDTSQQPYHFLRPNRTLKLPYSLAEIAPWLLLCLAGVGAFFLVRWLIRRRKRISGEIEIAPPPRPLHEIALEQLDRLRDKKLYQAGQIKIYYSELTDVIRRYIEARFGVPAMESTSFQLRRDVEAHLGDQSLVPLLDTLLTDADLAKFAKHCPEAETCQRDLENAYMLVNKTKPQPRPILADEAA